MHTIVKALCPDCQTVEIAPSKVVLLHVNALDSVYYYFVCPLCEKLIIKPIDGYPLMALARSGARMISINVPDASTKLEVLVKLIVALEDFIAESTPTGQSQPAA